MDLVDAWPLLGLRLRHADLELRILTDEDALAVASWIPTLLPPEEQHFMPLLFTNMRADDPEELARLELAWLWGRRASTTPDDWALPFMVLVDGERVGVQSCQAERFPVRRTIGSGSFLRPERRGRGIGTRARAVMLELVFGHLGGETAESGSIVGNETSRRVSERLGYQPNGVAFHPFDGRRIEERKLLLTRQRWAEHRPAWLDDLEVEGVGPVLDQLGLADGPT